MANGPSDRRAVIAIVGSALAVITAILIIVFVAIVPLPDFEEARPGLASGRIAFVSGQDDCIVVADLQLDSLSELTCEYQFPEGLAWTRRGIEVTVFSGQPEPIIVTLDPEDGTELDAVEAEPGEFPADRRDPSFVQRGREAGKTIVGPDGSTVLIVEGPETYALQTVVTNPDETWIAFVDSLGRLAVFEIGTESVFLVADDVRSFPAPVWER